MGQHPQAAVACPNGTARPMHSGWGEPGCHCWRRLESPCTAGSGVDRVLPTEMSIDKRIDTRQHTRRVHTLFLALPAERPRKQQAHQRPDPGFWLHLQAVEPQPRVDIAGSGTEQETHRLSLEHFLVPERKEVPENVPPGWGMSGRPRSQQSSSGQSSKMGSIK